MSFYHLSGTDQIHQGLRGCSGELSHRCARGAQGGGPTDSDRHPQRPRRIPKDPGEIGHGIYLDPTVLSDDLDIERSFL